jgi:hypothetical protein
MSNDTSPNMRRQTNGMKMTGMCETSEKKLRLDRDGEYVTVMNKQARLSRDHGEAS